MADIKNEKTENIDAVVQNVEESSFDFRAIYTAVVLNWQWFALSIFICICAALIYLRYTTPVYQVSVKMLIKDDNGRSRNANRMLSNMMEVGGISNSNGLENEVEILKSKILAEEVVKNLKLHTQYYSDGRVMKQLMYQTQPINIDLDPLSLNKLDESGKSLKMKVTREGKKYMVEGEILSGGVETPFKTDFTSMPAVRKLSVGTLTFTVVPGKELKEGESMYANISPIAATASSYVGRLSIAPTSKATSIALLSMKDINAKRGADFLTQLIACYNGQANADKNEIARRTEDFINERMDKINKELGLTEGQIESYKRSHNFTDVSMDASQAVAATSQFSNRISEVNAQMQMIDYMREYVDNPTNKYQIMPGGVGLTDAGSAGLIADYNKVVQDRNRLLRSASENAPQVVTLTNTLDELERSIRTSLTQARRSADIQRQSLSNQFGMYQSRVSSSPERERVLNEIGRQQEVKSGLYLMLLQKREENNISLAATADKGKLIDKPSYGGKISPNSNMIILMGLLFGIGIPALVLFLIQFLKYKVEGPDDLGHLTNLPLISEVPVASESAKTTAGIVVHENKNNQMDEIFRSMRTNIQFMMTENQKVILFTSSTSGEGKTFNAANLAVSFALLGKKVVLLGLDIRKPALGRLFGIADRTTGITSLLTKEKISMADLTSQLMPSGVNDNLDLLLAGPVPPNPTELLARKNLGVVIDLLKEKYDYIILDTAPVGLVSDTFQIGRYSDVSIAVVRSDYTPKASIGMLNTINAENKLPNLCIVLNGVDMSKKKYKYYYGYGKYGKYGRYGYGRYGYGRYGYGQYGYGRYGYGRYGYGNYGSYGHYAESHYGSKDDTSVKK